MAELELAIVPCACECGGTEAYAVENVGCRFVLGCICHTNLREVAALLHEVFGRHQYDGGGGHDD